MKWAASHLKISWILALLLLIGCLLGANRIMNGSGGINPFNRQPPGEKNASKNPSGQRYSAVTAGSVEPANEIIPLTPSIPGEVIEVLAKSGDQVKKGQPLLRMDDSLQQSAVKQAKALVDGATANLKMAENALENFPLKHATQAEAVEAAKVKRDIQQNNVNEYVRNKAQGLKYGSEADFENAKALLKASEHGLKAEEYKLKEIDASKPTVAAQVELAKSKVNEANSALDRAQFALEHCTLRAPEDGTILQSHVAVGMKFGDQAMLMAFRFYSGGLVVKANVPQESASGVREGQRVIVEDAANNDQSWQGEVTKVDNKYTAKREQGAIPGLNGQEQDPKLECRITLDAGKSPPLLFQKIRVKFLK